MDTFEKGFVDGEFDASYKGLQHCEVSSGSAFEVDVEIGLSQSVVVNGSTVAGVSPGICPDDIIKFNNEDHFSITTALTGSIEVARDSIDDSDSNFTQTEAGLITWTKDLGIKVEPDSEYLAAIRNIIMADSIGGYEGELIKAYSNGGFHIFITLRNIAEGYSLKELVFNAKTANFVDLFAEIDDEAEFTQSFSIEYSPFYELDGDVSKALGVPFSATMDATGSYDTATHTVTASVEVTSEYEALTKKAYVQIIDQGQSNTALVGAFVETGKENSFEMPAEVVGPFKIQAMYAFEQAQLIIPGKTFMVEARGTTEPTKKKAKQANKLGE